MSDSSGNGKAMVSSQPGMSLSDTLILADTFARSGYFADARSAQQAAVKILAGREMGFGPMASMADVHVIEGKPSIGAHLRAAAIKASDRYDYSIVRLDREVCKLQFYERSKRVENGEISMFRPVGAVAMTFKEAEASGLATTTDKTGKPFVKRNWRVHPDDMLFARCISQGYRRYCPDLTGGVLAYDPEEMGIDAEFEAKPMISATPPASPPAAVSEVSAQTPPPPPVAPLAQPALAAPLPVVKPPVPGMLDAEQIKYLGEKLKGKGDYARALLAAFGVRRFGEVVQSWWPLLRVCVDYAVKPDWFQQEILKGKTVGQLTDEEFGAALVELGKRLRVTKPPPASDV